MGSEVNYPSSPNEPLGGQSIEQHYGIVMLLDALGTRNLDVEQSMEFLRIKDKVLRWHLTLEKGREVFSFATESDSYALTSLWTFGDSFIYLRPVEPGHELVTLLKFCERASEIFVDALAAGMRLRGAISLGSYVRDAYSIVGPAIADAAAWHEQTDWMGIVLTPSTSELIIDFELTTEQQLLRHYLCHGHAPPIKERARLKNPVIPEFSINWPLRLLFDAFGTYRSCRLDARERAHELLMPPGSTPACALSKYQNTLDFFNYCQNHYLPDLPT